MYSCPVLKVSNEVDFFLSTEFYLVQYLPEIIYDSLYIKSQAEKIPLCVISYIMEPFPIFDMSPCIICNYNVYLLQILKFLVLDPIRVRKYRTVISCGSLRTMDNLAWTRYKTRDQASQDTFSKFRWLSSSLQLTEQAVKLNIKIF